MCGLMVELILETGLMANKMMKEFTSYLMELLEKAVGKETPGKNGLK